MMNYDFDQVIERSNTGAAKWDALEASHGRRDIIPLWLADMDFACPRPVVEALVNRAQHGIFGYAVRPDSYLEAIVGWLDRRHGWPIDRKWISHSPGVVAALSVIVRAFTQPGDKIIIQPPVYHPFYAVIEKQDREVVLNPLRFAGRRYEMDFEHLEAIITKDTRLLILCSPHNPVGRVWTADELRRLGEICLYNNILIVSDEIHHDLVYKEYRHTPLASISNELANNSVTCIAPSKTFNLAGLQTSVVIIPNPELKKRYDEALAHTFIGGANVFGVAAAEAAYRYGDEWLDQVLDHLHGNLDFLTRFMTKYIPEVEVIPPEGTYLVWLDFRKLGWSTEELNRFMIHEARLALNKGEIFGPGGDGFQRINIACSRPLLEKALNQLTEAIKSYQLAKDQ